MNRNENTETAMEGKFRWVEKGDGKILLKKIVAKEKKIRGYITEILHIATK